jgi:peptide/nickel transport system substrate-binding protein
MKKFMFLALAAIMALSIALTSCGGGELSKPGGGKEGGRLQLYTSMNVANLGDPYQTAGPNDAAMAFPVVEPLVIIGADGSLKPWLAESYVIADDGSSMTLNLRHGVSYTDGTPFNADAAKFNLDREINSTVWSNLASFSSCDKIDEYTVRLNFKNGQFNWVGAKSLAGFWSCMMFCPTLLQNPPDAEYCMTHVIGTGPFMLTDYIRDSKLVYDANPDYWRGKPYLDGIDYLIIPDPTVALLAYKSGDVDVLGVQAKDAQGLLDEGFQIRTSTDMVFNMCLIPSSKNPDSPLADVNVRRAIEYAIDKQALVDGLTYGYGVATNQEFCLPPYMDDTCVGYSYNLAESARLLTLAGYPNGIDVTFYQVDVMPPDLGLALQDQLKAANINVTIEKVSIIQFVNMIGTGGTGWEGYVFSYGFPGTTVDPASVLVNGPLNYNTTWISCAQPDELLDLATQAAQERDQQQRVNLYKEISRKMTDDYCMWTFMYYVPGLTSLAARVKGASIGEYSEFFVYTFAYLE